MTAEPQIGLLPYKRRQRFFWFLFLIFVLALPALIFYTSGNRLDFSEERTNIVSMGGIYLNSGYEDISVYLDEEEVRDRRIFRQAFYIQNVQAGKHRLHVQADGLQTWVKELPVYPYIVTEAQSFSLPVTPQLRLITERRTESGAAVVFASSSVEVLSGTTTNNFVVTTRRASSTFEIDPEFAFVEDLLSSTTATSTSLLQRFQQSLERFTFNSETIARPTTTATTTVEFQNMRLRERGSEIIAEWVGTANELPYYFCVSYESATTTAELYGAHIAKDIEKIVATSTEPVKIGDVVCRDHIQLDRKREDVYYFDFFPNSADFVVLHLEDGIYVTEIDDRSWQNVQILYPGRDLEMVINGGQIFVRDQEMIFEVVPTIEL